MLKKSILITGGTSGLGRELVTVFLKNGFTVVTTGRQLMEMPGFENDFRLFRVDFSDLKQTSDTIKEICKNYSFDIIINNAGILSPPDLTLTKDGNEYTFQVNYLAHLLVDELIIAKKPDSEPLTICSVTSPVYTLAKPGLVSFNTEAGYNPWIAYTYSKYFLAMLGRELPEKYPDKNITSFGFDPGIFGSGIYRMQSRFFGILYHIAAPFMRKPSAVARSLFDIIAGDELISGVIYTRKRRVRKLDKAKHSSNNSFREECHSKLAPYL
jgi:NAD(P)-dependent dehydrogenase (short-subunit alcohol dehydrogenase family)